jgi:hypothetical protein
MNRKADPCLKNIILQLEQEMYNRDMKMGEFSVAVFGNESRYYNFRKCNFSPTVKTLRKIATALGKDLTFSLTDIE